MILNKVGGDGLVYMAHNRDKSVAVVNIRMTLNIL